jgi:CheY-like chemotaxis protein
MPAVDAPALVQGRILIVDDNPANLKLLEGMLCEHGYDVRSFPRGRLALVAAEQEPPDLMLLDINMPEMNGYEVCERVKASARLSEVPVIFLSALNATEDKVNGFRSGGVDYISKPFQFEEVQARVETHLKLRRAQQAEHVLLEKTLRGAVGILWELVQLTSPMLAVRANAIREIVTWITTQIALEDLWQYELSAMLCLMGCVALPNEIFVKGYLGQPLSPDEDQMFRAHPERTAALLSKIPRLEVVAEIIRRQHQLRNQPQAGDTAARGAHILQLALELDRRTYQGTAFSAALAELKASKRFDRLMLEALKGYSPAPEQFDLRMLAMRDLRAGMVVEKDVLSGDGNLLILKEGTVLTETWIERLANFTKFYGSRNLVGVRVPRLGGISPDTAPGS